MSQKTGILVRSAKDNITVGEGVGLYTDTFQINSNLEYTLSFKCFNLNNTSEFNYIKLFNSTNVQTLENVKLETTTGLVIDGKNEYFVKLTFTSLIEGDVRLLIGRKYVSSDTVNTPLFFINEVQLQRGKYVSKYVETTNIIKRLIKLEQQFNVLSTEVNSRISKTEFVSKYNPILEELSSMDIKSDNLSYDLQTQIDSKIQTWSQNTDPSLDWTTDEDKSKHVGDLWYNPDTSETNRYEVLIHDEVSDGETTITNKSYFWELQPEAEKLAKTKSAIWVKKPTVPYYKNDIWILESDSAHTAGKKGEILTCMITRTSGSYNSSDWIKKITYTDDSYAKTVESNINQRADSIELSVNSLEEHAPIIKIDDDFAMSAYNWGHDNNASATDYSYEGKKYILIKAFIGACFGTTKSAIFIHPKQD